MNIDVINENIKELENSETTFENVQELAYLYTVKNNFQKFDEVETELNEIFPAYKKYVESKREYQLHRTDETGMIKYMEILCQEVADFLDALYSGTSTLKERKFLKAVFERFN